MSPSIDPKTLISLEAAADLLSIPRDTAHEKFTAIYVTQEEVTSVFKAQMQKSLAPTVISPPGYTPKPEKRKRNDPPAIPRDCIKGCTDLKDLSKTLKREVQSLRSRCETLGIKVQRRKGDGPTPHAPYLLCVDGVGAKKLVSSYKK